MKLQFLRENWHKTNSDLIWVNNKQKQLCSITYYILEFLNYNKLIHKSKNIENFNLEFFRYMCNGSYNTKEILVSKEKDSKIGMNGIRNINGDDSCYFESKVNGIKHTNFFLDSLLCDKNDSYQRSHQIKSSEIRDYLEKHKISLYNLEYFILLIFMMENTCVYAPSSSKKSMISNSKLELKNDLLTMLNSDLVKSHFVYKKLYNEETNTSSSEIISWQDFVIFRKELKNAQDFLVSKSFNIKNESYDKYKSLSHFYHNNSNVIKTIDNSTIPFISDIENILNIRNICFELLS